MNYRVKNLVLSVGLAALAAIFVTFYVTNYKRSVQQAEENVTVYVASGELVEGTTGASVAEKKLFRTEDIPRRSVVPGAITDPKDIEDLIVAETIYGGEQISKQRFRTLQEQGIRAELTGNVRAIQISGSSDQVLAGTLERGDRVDVLSNIKYNVEQIAQGEPTQGQTERVATRVVLRDLLVLHASTPTQLESQVKSSGGSASIQLALTDAQAQKLFFVIQNGAWTLQLRPVVDAADSPEGVETLESVLLDGLKFKQYRQLYAGRSFE